MLIPASSNGNFTNAPLSDFGLSRSRQNLEITILPSPNAVGSHNIADIQGNDHSIVLEAGTKGNTVISAGKVTDNGSNNITRIDLAL